MNLNLNLDGIEKCLVPLCISEAQHVIYSFTGMKMTENTMSMVQQSVDRTIQRYVARVPHYEDMHFFLTNFFLNKLEVV